MAYGFIPVKHALGGEILTNSFKRYSIASAYNTDLYAGDAVKLVAAGTIERCAAGDTPVGVFAGVSYKNSTTGDVVYDTRWPASTTATDIVAYVYDDPYLIFKVESDQDTTALAAVDVGFNADMIVAAGSATTKRSGMSLDSSTKAVTGTLVYRVLGSAEVDEAWTSAGTVMDVYVMHNLHFLKNTVAGI